jgi:RNA polymerase sigma-70 factor (ECF subfamily)
MVMVVGTLKLRRTIGVDNDNKAADNSKLIARACSNPAVFVRLYRRHYHAVFRYCVHRLFERQAAEDVTSDVFLKVVENIHCFRGNEHQFRNWLYRIATNAVNNYLRKTARRNRLLKAACEQANSPVADCADCGESADKLVLLREAVFSLKPRYQTIITLRFFENLKLTEIAEVLGSSPGTVRSQLARALAKLRKVSAKEFAEKSEVIENE